jgi:hypothetical protein
MVISRRLALWLLGLGGAAVIFRAWRKKEVHPAATAPRTDPGALVGPGAKRTTQAPCLDVAGLLPELAGRARTTVRLHPRRGPQPPRDGNKIGGLFHWPKDRDWPVCDDDQSPLVGILQLRREDFPELGFPGYADLFQLLWCPRDHAIWTKHRVFWHKRGEAKLLLDESPHPGFAENEYLPQPCLLLPERVTEYPPLENVEEAIRDKIEHWSLPELLGPRARERPLDYWGKDILDQPSTLYEWELSTCPGTKIGGYPHWIQRDETPVCRCGRAMQHLLTVASWEFDGGTFRRWLPAEEKHLSNPWPQSVINAHGMMLGDAGSIYFFICRHCPEFPVQQVCQCT